MLPMRFTTEMRPSFHRFRPLYVATQTLPSLAATIATLLVLDNPCLIEMLGTAYSRNLSMPLIVTAQTLPSRSSRSPVTVSPERPSASEKTSVLP